MFRLLARPHDGGCDTCKGVVAIGETISDVAFRNPDGSIVLLAVDDD
jgi:uncharacterized protein YqhQ